MNWASLGDWAQHRQIHHFYTENSQTIFYVKWIPAPYIHSAYKNMYHDEPTSVTDPDYSYPDSDPSIQNDAEIDVKYSLDH